MMVTKEAGIRRLGLHPFEGKRSGMVAAD
jgi:hypothetical protein